jgi:hypothetical protein
MASEIQEQIFTGVHDIAMEINGTTGTTLESNAAGQGSTHLSMGCADGVSVQDWFAFWMHRGCKLRKTLFAGAGFGESSVCAEALRFLFHSCL